MARRARARSFAHGAPTLWRRARADGSYASANDPRVLVGLGTSTERRTSRVTWPSGRVETFAGVPIDRYTTLAEGTGRSEASRALACSPVVVRRAARLSSHATRSAARDAARTLSRVDPGVQAQVRERYDTLKRAMDGSSTPIAELAVRLRAVRHGAAGRGVLRRAEPCYLNAQTLAPDDFRWPYYLANLYKSRGDTDKAEAAFKRALELQPDDLATLIWLGRLASRSRPSRGRRAAVCQGVRHRAAHGRGARRPWPCRRRQARLPAGREVSRDALAIDPEAESLHAPLATAYRGLGQLDKAQTALRQWRNRDLPVPDPLQQDMDLLLESGLSYELRGVREFEVRDWKRRRRVLPQGPRTHAGQLAAAPIAQHKLGTALYLDGDDRRRARRSSRRLSMPDRRTASTKRPRRRTTAWPF